ncbi:MAG: sulfite exporter TauE/SafE family protein [Candidatus Marinimicrobia bacterium]|nr:sulfite exporter TauE/SafE family protein [Candidatus Neomarinimicrobiota bacterium]
MSIISIVILVIIGLFTGAITGLTGSSGVVVVVPLLNMALNFSIHDAIGTSLLVDIIAPLAIAVTYHRHGNIDIRSGIWIAIGSIVGAQLGASFSAGMPESGLGGIFGIYLTILGLLIWKKGLNRKAIVNKFQDIIKFDTKVQKLITSLVLGFAIGIVTGLLGAGGGGMILIVLVFILDFPLHIAIGTSVLIMAITATSGTMGYVFNGHIELLAGLIIGFSAIFGGVGSAYFANKVNEKQLANTIGIVFMLLGLVMTAIRGFEYIGI